MVYGSGTIKRTKQLYGSGTIKPVMSRQRRTKSEMQVLRENILDDLSNDHPQNVRGVYYQIATTRQLLPKTDESYRVVQRLVLLMREEGVIPWEWITDSTRLMRKSASYDDVNDALDQATKYYRRALWNYQDAYVEIWCEKDATSGVIYGVTDRYDVPLMIARGQSSRTFIHESARYLRHVGKPCFIYHIGDCDKYGKNAAWNIEKRLRQYAPDADITFMRLAVTEEQIEEWNLPTRPEKDGSGKLVTEVDSIPAWRLRELVTWAIERHIETASLAATKRVEAAEKKTLTNFRKRWAA